MNKNKSPQPSKNGEKSHGLCDSLSPAFSVDTYYKKILKMYKEIEKIGTKKKGYACGEDFEYYEFPSENQKLHFERCQAKKEACEEMMKEFEQMLMGKNTTMLNSMINRRVNQSLKERDKEELEFLKNKASHFFVRDFFTNKIDEDWKEDNKALVNNILERIKQIEEDLK